MFVEQNTAKSDFSVAFLAIFHLVGFFSQIFSIDNYSHFRTNFFKNMKIEGKIDNFKAQISLNLATSGIRY